MKKKLLSICICMLVACANKQEEFVNCYREIGKILMQPIANGNRINQKYMFFGCTNLEHIYLNKFTINDSTNFYAIFDQCNKLKKLPAQ